MSCVIVHGNTDTDRGEFIPSPEHIAAECRAIQATWTDGEFANRRGGLRDGSNPARPAMKERKTDELPDKCNPVPYCCQCKVRLTVSPGFETSLHSHDGKLWCAGCFEPPAPIVKEASRFEQTIKMPKGYRPRNLNPRSEKYRKKQSLMRQDQHCSNCRTPLQMNQYHENRVVVIGNRLSCPKCMDAVRLAAALAGESVRNKKQILESYGQTIAAQIPTLASGLTAVKRGAV